MASRKDIISLPNASLRKKSSKIKVVDEKIRQLINDMIEAGLDWEDSRQYEVCVGLAAVQVDQLKRVVILRTDVPEDRKFTILINPKIIKVYGEPELDFEGCLSVKDVYGVVPRYPKVKVQALDENGKDIRITAEGFDARLIQHEVDHVEGIVFVDHIADEPEAFHKINDEGKIVKMDYEDVKTAGILR
jgi:peptide deformylase